MVHLRWSSLLLLVVFIAGCRPAEEAAPPSSEATVSSEADEDAIRALLRDVEQKWNAADLDGVLAHYADDVVLMPPDRDEIVGKDALRLFWSTFMEANTGNWKPTIKHIEVSGDLAFARLGFVETATPKDGGDTTTDVGKAISMYRRGADGAWRTILEIWNVKRTES